MGYDEMIYGLADEMLEKIAADDDDYGYDDGYYYDDGYEDYDGITEEDLDYMDDDELEALAEAMYEGELEKTAGARMEAAKAAVKGAPGKAWEAIKGAPGKAWGGVKSYGNAMSGKEWRAARKELKKVDKNHFTGKQVYDEMVRDELRPARRKTLKAWGGTAAGAAALGGTGYGVHRLRNKGQEKAAQMYEEAQLYKQAAEETWEEAQMIQDAASVVFDYLEY